MTTPDDLERLAKELYEFEQYVDWENQSPSVKIGWYQLAKYVRKREIEAKIEVFESVYEQIDVGRQIEELESELRRLE